MKLVNQKILYFSEEKSDKVYEVSLCESGQDLYLVNFKYGRRGANLREGTKTIFPVTYKEGLEIFDKLVASKVKKGYAESGTTDTTVKEVKKETRQINTAQAETILKYLKDASLGNYTRNWKISRVIWRATDLQIEAAVPLLAHFISSEDEFEQYAAIRAVSEFKSSDTDEEILTVFKQKGFSNKVGRIAAAHLLSSDHQQKITTAVSQVFPKEIIGSLTDKSAFFSHLSTYLLNDKDIDASVLYYVYLYAHKKEEYSHLLYSFIERIPLKVGTFKSIRYIYRAALVLKDYRFLALVSKRMATSAPGYTSSYLYIDGNFTIADTEKTKKNPSIAFSKKTKSYFSRNTFKNILDWSLSNTDRYITFAATLLSSLDDELDNAKEELEYHYNYESGSYNTEKRYFPKYHKFLSVMYIVYGGSERLQRQKDKWYYLEADEKQTREEAFPNLWDNKPIEVLKIVTDTKSEVAVTFALKIIKDNPHFLENLSDDIIKKLVQHYHPAVLEVILGVLLEKYKTSKPEESIVISLLQSKNERAINIGMDWLTTYEKEYFTAENFIGKLLLSNELLVVKYLNNIYKDSLKYNKEVAIDQIDSLFKTPDLYSFDYLLAINELIGNTSFGKLFLSVPETHIKELASSDVVTNKLFAANFSKHNSIPAYQLFKDSFESYIKSDDIHVRGEGIAILSHFPDSFLLEHHHRIGRFCFSEHKEVRLAIQPTIERLLPLNNEFKQGLLNQLLQAIIEDEAYDGLHESCYEVLTNYYGTELSSLTQENCIDLVLSKYDFAQKIGTSLFRKRVDLNSLTIEQLISISTSAVLDIRTSLHTYFIENISRINYELEGALRIFNSEWPDVITWSKAYFEEHITQKNWTVEILLYVCDHTKKEIQAFGRKMITQHFSDDKGVSLLVKLQEHPTKDMQFFVTNYLNNYAKDREDITLQLETYFKISLFNINTHRATKTRIYSFLKQESIKNKKVALMTVRLINAVLGTKTMLDNSNNIDVLLAIIAVHPEIEVPLTVNSY